MHWRYIVRVNRNLSLIGNPGPCLGSCLLLLAMPPLLIAFLLGVGYLCQVLWHDWRMDALILGILIGLPAFTLFCAVQNNKRASP